MPPLGKSQRPVVKLLSDKKARTAQQIGDALYASTSSCAKYGDGTGSMGGKATPEKIRYNWARNIMNKLKEKGIVSSKMDTQRGLHVQVWILTDKGEKIAKELM